MKQFAKFLAAISLLISCTTVAAQSIVARCDGCSDAGMRNAARDAAPPWDGRVEAYVFNNAAKSVAKFNVWRESEPGVVIVKALPTEIEPEVVKFAEDYWHAGSATQNIQVPEVIAPGIPDFIGNGAIRGDTRHYLQSQLVSLFSFPSNLTSVIAQALSGNIPALGDSGGLFVTLQFPDGGTVTVQITLHIDASTSTVGITDMSVVEGSAWLDGASFPTSPNTLLGGYARTGPDGLIGGIARAVRYWAVPLSCQMTSTVARIECNANGCTAFLRRAC